MSKVLVGGCFNSIHRGHILFLKEAKKYGTKLIVIVTHDENNTKSYAISAKKRKKLIKALNIANKVLVGDSKDKTKIVKKIKPDVIILGYDQKLPKGLEKYRVIRLLKINNYSTKKEKDK